MLCLCFYGPVASEKYLGFILLEEGGICTETCLCGTFPRSVLPTWGSLVLEYILSVHCLSFFIAKE